MPDDAEQEKALWEIVKITERITHWQAQRRAGSWVHWERLWTAIREAEVALAALDRKVPGWRDV